MHCWWEGEEGPCGWQPGSGYQKDTIQGFPGGSVEKNLSAKSGDTGLISDPGRSHMPWSSKSVRHSY